MKIQPSKQFVKQYDRFRKNEQLRIDSAIRKYIANQNDKSLRIHELKGEHRGIFSMSAGGDIRIHFQILEDGTILFLRTVGTHSQLY